MKKEKSPHTTNYFSTLIEVAQDCKYAAGTPPPESLEKPTIAALQFQKLAGAPYEHTSDELLFAVWAERNNVTAGERADAQEAFFSKGQPCMRASPLTKSWGWGIHFDGDGKMALLGCETETYQRLQENETVQKVKAMRSTKK